VTLHNVTVISVKWNLNPSSYFATIQRISQARDNIDSYGMTLVDTAKPRLHQNNMLPGNKLLVAGNMLPVSRQHVSLCIQQQTGNKLATILLPATYCLKQHVALV